MEEWRDIEFYEGCYQVSSFARVRSLDRFVRYAHGLRLIKGRILKNRLDSHNKYALVDLCVKQIKKTRLVHGLVARAFIPNPTNLPEVNHKDGIRTNNLPSNLEWVNRKQNVAHAWAIGLNTLENRPKWFQLKHKLNPEQAKEIRKLYLTGTETFRSLAKKFGVGKTTIESIIKNKLWKYA